MAKLQLTPLRIDDCEGCPLTHTGQLSPDMPTSGEGKLGVMIIGEAQGAIEAQEGTQFIGPAGQLLRTVLTSLSLDLDRDFWKTNAIRCFPKKREPTTTEINACNKKLFKSIHKRKPKIVIPLGKHALVALIGKYVNDITISKFRGLFIPIPEHNFYLAPALHPSFVLRQDDDYSYATLQRDLKETLSLLEYIPDGHIIESLNIHKPIHLVTDYTTFSALMEKIHKEKPISAFDFETSSKKPQDPRSKIWSMSICFNGKSYSFPVQYPAVQGVYPKGATDTMWGTKFLPLVIDKIKRYLQDSACKKIVQNESFERIWSHFVFKSPVNSLVWCTMNRQHILDARKGFCGLKLQAFVRWGVHHYDEEISYYIKSKEGCGANALNQLHRAPLESLLLYGGIDSFLTEKLAKAQLEVFNLPGNKPMHEARKLFHQTAIAFTNCQKTGINIDIPHYQKVKTYLTKEITKNIQAIQTTTEVKHFENTERREFNLNSPVDLRILLFDILGEESKKKTTTGLDSVDKDVLTDLRTPIGKKIVKIREFKKLRDTYIAQYLREEVGGRVYPFLHTHIARSGRSSASAPNVQNTPERNEKAKKLIKRGIISSPGYKMAEVDFCLAGSTLLETIGKKRTIKEVVAKVSAGKEIYIYCYNKKEQRIGISKVTRGTLAKKKDEVWKVTLDNNESILITPDHKMMLRDGSYTCVKDLAPGASLMPLCKYPKAVKDCPTGYIKVELNRKDKNNRAIYTFEHRLIAKDVFDISFGKKRGALITHHKDGNGQNNALTNLEFITRSEHMQTHIIDSWKNIDPTKKGRTDPGYWMREPEHKARVSLMNSKRSEEWTEEQWGNFGQKISQAVKRRGGHHGANNPMFGRKQSEETKRKISEARKRRSSPKKESHIALKNHKITSIEFYGYEDTYNICVKDHHNFALAAGVIVKNSGIEINILGCEIKDKALLKYLWNPKSDMHFDQGKSLFVLDNDGMNKTLRYNAKSEFVFLQVYGGKADASAKYLWFSSMDIKTGKDSDGPILRRHLAQQGIRNLDDFTEHVREVESAFWKKFPGIRRWQKSQGEFYLKHGYVETHFGFRRSGYLKWEVILNTQTQSTAAHLLWWCFNRVDQIRIKEKWKTKLLGQIHDSILPDIHPDEEEHAMKTIHRVMTQDVVKEFPWIIVPIGIEIEMAEVDQSWYDIKAVPKEYYKTLTSKEEIATTRGILKSRVMRL